MGADMTVNNVLDLAARQASWLLARENLVAQNVANANTPGYKAADLKPFEASLQTASLQLTATSPRHFSIAESVPGPSPALDDDSSSGKGEAFLSGNDVSLEQEMMKGSEVNRAYALNAALAKAFNGMLLQSTKG